MVEIARAQHANLFDEPQDFSFDADAVYRLSRHKYPFAGLLKLVGTEGIEISPVDPYYIGIQDKNEDALGREFNSVSNRAGTILSSLVSMEKEAGAGQEGDAREIEITKRVFSFR